MATTIILRINSFKLHEEYGTPLYVYHAEKIKAQYEKLQKAFAHSNTRFFYASKALTNVKILQYIREIGCNMDCSSINEVRLALKAGFAPEIYSILPTA